MLSRRLLALTTALAALFPFALQAQAASLPFEPIDAQYSSSLDKIIMVSANPNELHIYDPATGEDTKTVPLSYVPLNLAVSPDGSHAAVMHNSAVSYVNLQTGTVEQEIVTTATTGQVVLSDSYLYILPNTYYSASNAIAINLQTMKADPDEYFLGDSGGRLDAAVGKIYSIDSFDLSDYDVSTGPIQSRKSSPYFQEYSACGDLWFSPDGSRVYTGCGTVFHASADPSVDMTYLTTLWTPAFRTTSIQSLTTSATANEVAIIPSGYTNADTDVRLYESKYLNQVARFVLPSMTIEGYTYTAHGRWIFFKQDGSAIYVIAEASPTENESDFAVDTIDLTNPATCLAGFASTATVNVAASGSLETTAITSNTNCAFQATSNESWIDLVYGSYGSGDTTLKYVVRPNPNLASRTGAITLNSGGASATLNISQDPSTGVTSGLVNLSVNLVAADYSKALDKLVYVSASPNELHLYDPSSQADTSIALAARPLSVSVDPTGMYAAVGHDGWISYLSLQPLKVLDVFPIAADVQALSTGANGYVYAFPRIGNQYIFSLQLSDGKITRTLTNYRLKAGRILLRLKVAMRLKPPEGCSG